MAEKFVRLHDNIVDAPQLFAADSGAVHLLLAMRGAIAPLYRRMGRWGRAKNREEHN